MASRNEDNVIVKMDIEDNGYVNINYSYLMDNINYHQLILRYCMI